MSWLMDTETQNLMILSAQTLAYLIITWRLVLVEKGVKAIKDYLNAVSQYIATTELGKALKEADAAVGLSTPKTGNPTLS